MGRVKTSQRAVAGAVALVWAVAPAGADTDDACGTIFPDQALQWLHEMHDAGLLEAPEAALRGPPITVPVTMHVVRDSDESGGASAAQVAQGMIDLRNAFRGAQIRFCLAGPIDWIDDTAFASGLTSAADLADQMRAHNAAGTINVYVIDEMSVNGETLNCGVTPFQGIHPVGITVKRECLGVPGNPSTLPHEMGHFFTLPHTHCGSPGPGGRVQCNGIVECPDRSNAALGGDEIADTPPDPGLRRGIHPAIVYDVSEAPSCRYLGKFAEADRPDLAPPACTGGQPAWDPDTRNIMSYSRPCCRTRFSPGQRNRMLAALVNLPYDLAPACDPPVGVTDLLTLLVRWGAVPRTGAPCASDLSGDGEVGIPDLLLLLSAWG